MNTKVRGIRGAITVSDNTRAAIEEGASTLLQSMLEKNDVMIDDICSIFFTVTPDLTKEFPAVGARKLGLVSTPLMCMTEIPVDSALEKCIRILVHLNTDKLQSEIKHVYLRDARKLRPDITEE